MRTPGLVVRVLNLLVLFAPAAVLGLAADRFGSSLLALGAGAAAVGGLLFVRAREAWRPPVSGTVILLYLSALGWLWFATQGNQDSFVRWGRGGLLLAAVLLLANHDLVRTGVGPRRKAAKLCQALLGRRRWPDHPAAYAELPEVRALQEALRDDPGPAFDLLADPRVEVRTAALVALHQREYWRPGEAAVVLEAVHVATEPRVRIAGLAALWSANDPDVLMTVADYLRDASPDVRRTAAEALLVHGQSHWPLLRDPIRAALADPVLANDGSLLGAAGRLPAVAVCDLAAWASEPDPLATRATRTLIDHYAVFLQDGSQPGLASEIGVIVTDPTTPPGLRLELAGLLRGLNLIPPTLLDRMTDSDQPGPIRLLAAEILLAADPTNEDAIDVLRGLGRQSNRETALAIARLLQTYLRLDMGLPATAVAANSKLAADAAKLVMQWASGRPASSKASAPTPPRITMPGAKPAPTGVMPTGVPRPPAHHGSSGQMWVPRS
jgi:hypothetical protein